MTDATTIPLYARVPRSVKARLDRLADETGLTIAQVAGVLLARSLGMRWDDTPEERIRRALNGMEQPR